MGIETENRAEYRVESIDFQMDSLTTPDAVRDDGCAKMRELVPALAGIRWEDSRVGLISFAGDGEPILGPVQEFPGLFVACSFHSGGFSYNAVAGLLIAEHVLDGRTQIDTSVFSPDRFDADETERHLAETVPQCQAVRRRH
jgi:glycine/D-amino acid oxidase-like deaminating enzyme